MQFVRRWFSSDERWFSSDGWAKTSEVIELTLRKIELITEAAANTNDLIQNPNKISRLSEVIAKAWSLVNPAVMNSVNIGKDYKEYDKDEVASKKIVEMGSTFHESFKKHDWRMFFIEDQNLLSNFLNQYFHVEVKQRAQAHDDFITRQHMIDIVSSEIEDDDDYEIGNLDLEKKTDDLASSTDSVRPFPVSKPIPIMQMTKHEQEDLGDSSLGEHSSNEGDVESNQVDLRNRVKKTFSQGIIDDVNAEKNKSESRANSGKSSCLFGVSPPSGSPSTFFKNLRYYPALEWPNL